VLYLDTCIEPWAGYYDNAEIRRSSAPTITSATRCWRRGRSFKKNGPSALVTHGANPGLISHFIKRAALDIAKMRGLDAKKPTSRESWAKLMQSIGVKVIHIAEHDLQVADVPKQQNEFVNTWSTPASSARAASRPSSVGHP